MRGYVARARAAMGPAFLEVLPFFALHFLQDSFKVPSSFACTELCMQESTMYRLLYRSYHLTQQHDIRRQTYLTRSQSALCMHAPSHGGEPPLGAEAHTDMPDAPSCPAELPLEVDIWLPEEERVLVAQHRVHGATWASVVEVRARPLTLLLFPPAAALPCRARWSWWHSVHVCSFQQSLLRWCQSRP